MDDAALIDVLDTALNDPSRTLGAGVVGDDPSVEILRFYARSVRLSAIPWFGKGLSLVAVAREPDDLRGVKGGLRTLLERAASAAGVRYPPRKGLSLALSLVVVLQGEVAPELSQQLGQMLTDMPRFRCVPLALVALDLRAETMAMALRRGPAGLYSEPEVVIDALTPHFRQFLPLVTG